MFGWFKRKPKTPECLHYKQAGYPAPENMRQIFRFSDSEKDTIGYGISECTDCGVRAFSCLFCHCMSSKQSKTIDQFIRHEITREEFVTFLKTEMKWWREEI